MPHNNRGKPPLREQAQRRRLIPAHYVTRRNATRSEYDWARERRRLRYERRKHEPSKFDVQPTTEELLAQQALASVAQAATLNGSTAPPMSQFSLQQQTRHARRLYLGNVSDDVSEAEVKSFMLDCVEKATGDTFLDDPILSVYINRERKFCFVEFTSIELCTSSLQLDGINLCGKGVVKVKRPNDYNPALMPNPPSLAHFDVSKLGIIGTIVADGPNKIFIGGLPYHLTDDQVLELLGAFGKVKAFNLVRDPGATNSKGYCFVEYVDPSVTEVAVRALEGMNMGEGKTITAKRASAAENIPELPNSSFPGAIPGAAAPTHNAAGRLIIDGVDVDALVDFALGLTDDSAPPKLRQAPPPEYDPHLQPNNQLAFQPVAPISQQLASEPVPTLQQDQSNSRVIVLENMVTDEDLVSDEDYQDLTDEVREECEKFGRLVSMRIPRPGDPNVQSTAVKKIYIEYATILDASTAWKSLAGRKFGTSIVTVKSYDESLYKSGALE